MKTNNYSRMTESQKQEAVDNPSLGHIFESSEDFDDWMNRVAKKVQEKQDKEK